MIASTTILLATIFIGLGTFALRACFLLFADWFQDIPDGLMDFMEMIPPAAFAALVLPALLIEDGQLRVFAAEPIAGFIAAAVAWRTRSMFATLSVGLVAVVILESAFSALPV